ncbi:MAG: hypothetical protein ACK4MG_11340 [Aquabacterium sp.]
MLKARPFAHLVRLAGVVALVAGSAAASAGGGVYWSVNVDTPMHGVGRIGTTMSNSPYGVVVAAPQVVMPVPVVVHQPRVVYAPPPAVVYGPPVRYVHPGHGMRAGWGRHHHHHHHHHHGHGHDGWRGHHGR